VPRPLPSLLTICALALLAPASASAGTPPGVEIDGSPLNVWAGGDGSVQVSVDGYPRGEWFPPSTFDSNGNEIPRPDPNAGFGLVVDPGGRNLAFGKFIGSLPMPASGPNLAPGNPATITTTWQLFEGSTHLLDLTQVLSYANGSRQFDAAFTVMNVSNSPQPIRADMAGDMAIRGSDSGVGFLEPGPPRFVGGQNLSVGAAGGFVEDPSSPWAHYEVAQYGTVRDHAANSNLDDTLVTTLVDNGAGVQWPDITIPPGESASFKVGQKFVDTLGLTPPTSNNLTGGTLTLTVTAGDLSGNQVNHQTIHYTVSGSNDLSGKVDTGADGKATFSYVGGNPGTDLITAFIDKNGNGTRDDDEPQAQATAEWQGSFPPVQGFSAGVRPVSGTVKIKLPPGTTLSKAKALGLTGAASKFVRLTGAHTVPLGSTLDTSRGTVNLLSSAGHGKFQAGNFNGGQFRFTQTRKNPLTQLSMVGGGLSGCSTPVPRGGSAARKKRRKLFGSARGRFRTRGRHSSATVRGTKWTMTDTCAGTLTVVSQGVVVVRDFTLRKNKTVKAGHRYFAKAPKRRKR
jgi:hypothetical protein